MAKARGSKVHLGADLSEEEDAPEASEPPVWRAGVKRRTLHPGALLNTGSQLQLPRKRQESNRVQADGQDYTRTHPARGQGGSFPKLALSPALSLHIPACASTAEGHPRPPERTENSKQRAQEQSSECREGGSGERRLQGPELCPLGQPLLPTPLGKAAQPRPALKQSGDAGPGVEAGSPLRERMAEVN